MERNKSRQKSKYGSEPKVVKGKYGSKSKVVGKNKREADPKGLVSFFI